MTKSTVCQTIPKKQIGMFYTIYFIYFQIAKKESRTWNSEYCFFKFLLGFARSQNFIEIKETN